MSDVNTSNMWIEQAPDGSISYSEIVSTREVVVVRKYNTIRKTFIKPEERGETIEIDAGHEGIPQKATINRKKGYTVKIVFVEELTGEEIDDNPLPY